MNTMFKILQMTFYCLLFCFLRTENNRFAFQTQPDDHNPNCCPPLEQAVWSVCAYISIKYNQVKHGVCIKMSKWEQFSISWPKTKWRVKLLYFVMQWIYPLSWDDNVKFDGCVAIGLWFMASFWYKINFILPFHIFSPWCTKANPFTTIIHLHSVTFNSSFILYSHRFANYSLFTYISSNSYFFTCNYCHSYFNACEWSINNIYILIHSFFIHINLMSFILDSHT